MFLLTSILLSFRFVSLLDLLVASFHFKSFTLEPENILTCCCSFLCTWSQDKGLLYTTIYFSSCCILIFIFLSYLRDWDIQYLAISFFYLLSGTRNLHMNPISYIAIKLSELHKISNHIISSVTKRFGGR